MLGAEARATTLAIMRATAPRGHTAARSSRCCLCAMARRGAMACVVDRVEDEEMHSVPLGWWVANGCAGG